MLVWVSQSNCRCRCQRHIPIVLGRVFVNLVLCLVQWIHFAWESPNSTSCCRSLDFLFAQRLIYLLLLQRQSDFLARLLLKCHFEFCLTVALMQRLLHARHLLMVAKWILYKLLLDSERYYNLTWKSIGSILVCAHHLSAFHISPLVGCSRTLLLLNYQTGLACTVLNIEIVTGIVALPCVAAQRSLFKFLRAF